MASLPQMLRRPVVLPGASGLSSLDRSTGELVGVQAIEQPPSCNTGAEMTECGGAAPIIDWLTVTFRPEDGKPEPLVRALGLFGGSLSWEPQGYGDRNYVEACQRGHVRVLWGGDSTGGTVCVKVSGQGCRQLEAEGLVAAGCQDVDDPWRGFLGAVIREGGRFTRVDVAWDDTTGLLSVGRVRDAWEAEHVSSQHRDHQHVLSGRRGKQWQGETFYIGSEKSKTRVRVYDKRGEQLLAKGVAEESLPAEWVRLELECRDIGARKLVAAYVQQGAAGLMSALRKVVDFTDPDSQDSRRSRRPLADWWKKWVGEAERLSLRMAPAVPTVAGVARWVERQVAPALAMLVACPSYGLSWLQEVIRSGGPRLSSRHVSMLLAFAGAGGGDHGQVSCAA